MAYSLARPLVITTVLLITSNAMTVAQQPSYPKEIRGYKVERTVVEIKKPEKKKKDDKQTESSGSEADTDALIKFGTPQLAKVTPLGISLEIPIVVAPVRQKGHVEFMVFEEMVVNGTSVDIDEYHREFDLPNSEPRMLQDPLNFYIFLPSAVLAAIDEWSNSKPTWLVTGRIYVFGKFKKGPFSFKRCVPVELKMTMENPLR
jgi:hypothetical protein